MSADANYMQEMNNIHRIFIEKRVNLVDFLTNEAKSEILQFVHAEEAEKVFRKCADMSPTPGVHLEMLYMARDLLAMCVDADEVVAFFDKNISWEVVNEIKERLALAALDDRLASVVAQIESPVFLEFDDAEALQKPKDRKSYNPRYTKAVRSIGPGRRCLLGSNRRNNQVFGERHRRERDTKPY